MGALFDLPVVVDADLVETLKMLKGAGFAVCSLNPEATTSLTACPAKPWPGKLALLLGNEGAGLSAEAEALADLDLKIEISAQIESLNVSIAAAIVLFHLANVAKPSLKQD
jgi:TrmH family RNA methyltransferase